MATSVAQAAPFGTAFTYQGLLEDAGGPVTAVCDFEFALYQDSAGTMQVGTTQLVPDVAVTGGAFTVGPPDLDFGAGAFDGTARWLEVSVCCPATCTPVALTPLVELAPAPHALAMPGLYTVQNATSPNLIGGHSSNSVTTGVVGATIAGGGASGPFTNQVTDDFGTVGGGRHNRAGDGAMTTMDKAYATVGGGGDNTASGFYSTVGGGSGNTAAGEAATVAGGSGNMASGKNAIVLGGTANHAGGDYSLAAGAGAKTRTPAETGDSNGDELSFVWADGSTEGFTSTGPQQFLIQASGGVGINTNTPGAHLTVATSDPDFDAIEVRNANPVFVVTDDGRLSLGDPLIPHLWQLAVTKTNSAPVGLNRSGTDGSLIEFLNDGAFVGTISVSGATVSYNAFTGSHYGWTDETIARGTLVTLTGENRRREDNPGSEPTYGIAPTTQPNDPKCLGAYLGLLEPSKAADAENPHQVMAVGNGDMWVVDTGRNIEPGQYLISSDLKGHAMLDDEGRFPVGYVIARAAEPVDWSSVSETNDGRKHKRISVFFESFERGSAVGVGKIVEQQRDEIQNLRSRLEVLERAGSGGVVRAALPLTLLGIAGLIAIRRRNRVAQPPPAGHGGTAESRCAALRHSTIGGSR